MNPSVRPDRDGEPEILVSAITFFGQRVTLACDGKCEKAFKLPDFSRRESNISQPGTSDDRL